MNFYGKIDELLKEKNISRRRLAELICVPYSTIASAFSRKSEMPLWMITRVVTVLDVPLGFLLPEYDGWTIEFVNTCPQSPLSFVESRIGRAYGKADEHTQKVVDVALSPFMEEADSPALSPNAKIAADNGENIAPHKYPPRKTT